MNKEIKEKAKLTEEGRLKIKEIRRAKLGNGLYIFKGVVFGFLGLLAVLEGGCLTYFLLSGYDSGHSKIYDIFLAITPFVLLPVPYSRVTEARFGIMDNNERIKTLENEIIRK